jgi:hypothetical protein
MGESISLTIFDAMAYARAREPCANEPDEQLNGKPVRQQDRFGTAIRAAGEQRECPAVFCAAHGTKLTRHGALASDLAEADKSLRVIGARSPHQVGVVDAA